MHNNLAPMIGQRIRLARREQGLRQDELALASGVSTRAVHQVEAGKPTSRLDIVVSILTALGLTLDVVDAPRGTFDGS